MAPLSSYLRYIRKRRVHHKSSKTPHAIVKMNSAFNYQSLRPEPYRGNTLGLVIGIDVGTTFSSVSYAVLRPDEVPEVRTV